MMFRLTLERLYRNMKKPTLRKGGGRRSGGKDLERLPLTVLIQAYPEV